MDGHDPEDQREPCEQAFRSLCQMGHSLQNAIRRTALHCRMKINRMTLCGSEVPQDRWRGRTAGSGMWTRTENLLSWSPCGDSAIPYG